VRDWLSMRTPFAGLPRQSRRDMDDSQYIQLALLLFGLGLSAAGINEYRKKNLKVAIPSFIAGVLLVILSGLVM
jgi:hypothetical protein